MILKLIEDIKIKQTQVTIEYKEKDIKVDKLIDFVTHLDEMDNNIMASSVPFGYIYGAYRNVFYVYDGVCYCRSSAFSC